MSYIKRIILVCDECGEEFEGEDGEGIRSTRSYFKEIGWLVNRKPSEEHPSLYSYLADFCSWCKQGI